ncbi:hypothetical protein FS837_011478 [Tulasnella sp. UAMH 9824]|nr:hypothetical protein FS837_011478 [Tulasnella sp. UAMH 9824]
MDRLSTEIFQYLLTIIFEATRHGSEPWGVYTRMFQLRLVSTAWMVAIDSHPPLWTWLTNRHGEQVFSRVIERSGILPLDIELYYWSDDDPVWYTDAVKVQLSRAASIAASVHWFDGTAPKLQTVIMVRGLPNWKSFLAWDLKRLEIQLVSEPQEKEFEGLLQVVSASPGLEELELVRWRHKTPIRRIPSAREVTSLDRLRKVRLDIFPWQWAVPLLETIRIPRSCVSNILVDASREGPPIDAALRVHKRELTQAETVAISLVAKSYSTTMELTCTSIATESIRFKVSESKDPYDCYSDGISRALNVIQGLKTPNQNLRVPVDLSITRDFSVHMSAPVDREFSSMMITADPLFPPVTKLRLDSSSQPLFLKHSNWSRFTNLSEIEIKGYNDRARLNHVAEWVPERAALANSEPNVTPLKTVTIEAKYVQMAVIESISDTLRGVVDLHWT